MLPLDAQRRLAKRYGGDGLIKEAFDQNVVKAFQQPFAEEKQETAAVLMVDIASFSAMVAGWSATDIRSFLDDYYAQVMPILFRYGGMIDRVAGDGILAVFSKFFAPEKSSETHYRQALRAAESVVAKVAKTAHSSKAALSNGPLFFCKTGVAGVYEEHTVIGEPITAAYRIEDVAEENQVLVHGTTAFSAIIEAQLEARLNEVLDAFLERGKDPGPVDWKVERVEKSLRGIGKAKIYVETLAPK